MNKEFRLAGRNILLQYSGCQHLVLEDIAKHIIGKFPKYCQIKNYLVVSDGDNVLGFFSLNGRRIDSTNEGIFDLTYPRKSIRGSYQTLGDGFTTFCEHANSVFTVKNLQHVGCASLFGDMYNNLTAYQRSGNQYEADPMEREAFSTKLLKHLEEEYISYDASTNHTLRSPELSHTFSSYPPSKSNSLSSNSCKIYEEKIRRLEEENSFLRRLEEENSFLREENRRIQEESSKQLGAVNEKLNKMFYDMQQMQRQIFQVSGSNNTFYHFTNKNCQ